jgi:two-component system response regulator NreC
MSIRVLVADDHALVRAGVRALLAAQPDIEVVGEAEDGAVVVERCERLKPDVVLMDLTMPGRGGVSATEDIHRARLDVKVLVLTMHEDEAYARQARLAGAAGYVLKRALATELIRAIRAVSAGKSHFPADDGERPVVSAAPLELLSDREREVVSLIALGHTNAEIAGKLHISEKTVETHRAHVFEKLGLKTRADLVRFALEHDLLRT